jgi:hypothetical protein
MRKLLLLALPFSFLSCSSAKTYETTNSNPSLTLLNSIEIPFNKEFKTQSLVDYLVSIMIRKDLYYFICDDRAVYNDARFILPKYI